MKRKPEMKRREFLAGVVAAAPVATLASTTAAGAQSAAAPRTSTVPPVPPNENVLPAPIRLTESRSGSDFMVDVIKTLNIDYIASLPAATFRGLQESLLNYGMNTKPEFILCLHEECAVAMAHGYAKVARKPMACMVHGTVGLQHASMAIYNAYADRAPILVISGNMQNTAARRPNVEWNHAALDQNAMVRDFTKWDAQPTSLQSTAEALVQAYDLATTAPMGPVLVTIDADVQEDPLEKSEEADLRIPKLRRRAHPQGDDESLREAAKLLVAAENPVIYANRYGRSERAPALLVQFSELLNAPVVDGRARMNFPSRHKFNHSGRREQAFAQADVLLGARAGRSLGPHQRCAGSDRTAISSAESPCGPESDPYRYRKSAGQVELRRGAALRARRFADPRRCRSNHALADRSGAARADSRARRSTRRSRSKLADMAPRLLEQARADAVYGWDARPSRSLGPVWNCGTSSRTKTGPCRRKRCFSRISRIGCGTSTSRISGSADRARRAWATTRRRLWARHSPTRAPGASPPQ